MANDLLSIFQFGFMQRALIAGLVIATVCGVLGVFVVLRRTAPLGDALAHVSFGGVAIGIAAGLFPIEMAILIAVLGGIGIRVLQERHLSGELSLTVLQAAGLGGGRPTASRRTQRDLVGRGLHRNAVRRRGPGPRGLPERRGRRDDRAALPRGPVHLALDGGPIETRRVGRPSVARGRRSLTSTAVRSH